MNKLYYGDCLNVLKEMHRKSVQIHDGGAMQTTFKKSVNRIDVVEEEITMFE